jgi:hypothetical protein
MTNRPGLPFSDEGTPPHVCACLSNCDFRLLPAAPWFFAKVKGLKAAAALMRNAD